MRSTLIAWGIITFGALILIALICIPLVLLESYKCHSQWKDFKPTWGPIQLCMIETKTGQRIPSSAYREIL